MGNIARLESATGRERGKRQIRVQLTATSAQIFQRSRNGVSVPEIGNGADFPRSWLRMKKTGPYVLNCVLQ